MTIIMGIIALLMGCIGIVLAESENSNTAKKGSTNKIPSTPVSTVTTTKPEAEKPWSVGVDVEHHLGFQSDIYPYTQFGVLGVFKPSERHTISVAQPMKKLYEVPQYGESEFQLDDTSISHNFQIAEDFYGFGLNWKTGITLPVSQFSRSRGVITKPSVALKVDRKFLDERLTLSYQPFYRYYFKQYTTTVSGTPLPVMTLGHTLGAEFELLPKLSLSLSGTGSYSWKEKHPTATQDPPVDGDYGYETALGYEISKNLNMKVGYGQADSFVKDGRYEVQIFDPGVSRFFFGVGLSF